MRNCGYPPSWFKDVSKEREPTTAEIRSDLCDMRVTNTQQIALRLLDRLDAGVDENGIHWKNVAKANQNDVTELADKLEAAEEEKETLLHRLAAIGQELSIEVAVRKQAVADLKVAEQTVASASELPEKWREDQHGCGHAMITKRDCADELEAILNRSKS